MEDRAFLKERGVWISSRRIVIGGQRFPTGSIDSVKVESPGVSTAAIVVAVAGVVTALAGALELGVFALALGGVWAYLTASKRRLVLDAVGGPIIALESSDSRRIERARAAVANAIAVR